MAVVTFDRPTDRADELQARQGSVRFIDIPTHPFVMERLRTVLRHPVR